MKWELKQLDEIGYISRGKSRHRPRNDERLYGGIYPLIQTGDIQKANLYINDFETTYNEVGLAQSKLWETGTLCISIVGANTAATAILGFDACFPDSVIGFNGWEGKSVTKFVKYFLDTKRIELHRISLGTARENLSMEKLLSMKIPVPPFETQQKIASILSSYDDLIENNLRRIRLLEEAAQHLYREWFVRFRFPGWEEVRVVDGLPEGWERKQIGEVIDYHIGGGWGQDEFQGDFMLPAYVIRGTDIPKLQQGNGLEVPFRFHTKSNLSSRKLQEGDLVFEVSGGSKGQPVGRSLLITSKILDYFGANDVMCASFCKLVRVNQAIFSPYYFEAYIKESYTNGTLSRYENQSASNIMNFRFADFLSREEIVVPSKQTLEDFEYVIAALKNQTAVLGLQIQKLKSARDILLPRLMNQTIEV